MTRPDPARVAEARARLRAIIAAGAAGVLDPAAVEQAARELGATLPRPVLAALLAELDGRIASSRGLN